MKLKRMYIQHFKKILKKKHLFNKWHTSQMKKTPIVSDASSLSVCRLEQQPNPNTLICRLNQQPSNSTVLITRMKKQNLQQLLCKKRVSRMNLMSLKNCLGVCQVILSLTQALQTLSSNYLLKKLLYEGKMENSISF